MKLRRFTPAVSSKTAEQNPPKQKNIHPRLYRQGFLRRRIRKPLFLIIFLSLFAAYVCAKLYIPKANIGWDESVHLFSAYQIYHALRMGNLQGFFQTTLAQFDYPPLQSWTIGIPLVPFGFSIQGARMVNLFWFILGSLLLYQISQTFEAKRGNHLIGLISVLFFLTSPLMLLHAGLVTKEMMGATINLALILLYLKARRNNQPIYFAGVSFLLIGLFLTKYNYGVLAAAALFLESVVSIFISKKRFEMVRNHLMVFIPFGTSVALWVLTSTERISKFIVILTNVTTYTLGLTNSWGYLMFYPRAIIFMYSASPAIGFILLFSLLLAIFHFRDYRIRVLWFSIIPNLILGTIHPGNMQERYLFTSIPPLFFLGAFTGVNLIKEIFLHLQNKLSRLLFFLFLFLVGIKIFSNLFSLPNYIYSIGAYTQKNPFFNQVDYTDLWFNYDRAKWSQKLPSALNEKPADVVEYVASNIDLSKPIEVIGRSNELAPPYFDLVFALHREKNDYPRLPYSSYLVTVEVLPSSRYYTRDFVIQNSFLIGAVRDVEKDQSLTLLSQKTFHEIGVKVGIYTK